MRLCVFEDAGVEMLEPVTLTRPAFGLWCGASTLLDRQRHHVNATETGALVRPALAEFTKLHYDDLAVNDWDWLRRGATIHLNARWLPPNAIPQDWSTPRVGLVGHQVAYVIGDTGAGAFRERQDVWLDYCMQSLPHVDAGGIMVEYLCDLVDHNASSLNDDELSFRTRFRSAHKPELTIIGAAEKVIAAPSAVFEPHVVVDTRCGPVLIDDGAVIQSFTRLEGPCYVGKDSWIVGGKLSGSAIGPNCRMGGEVQASIVQGYSNKYHDGFLGHSYVGSWVNLAAGTQTSDLRNDYGSVRVRVAGVRVATGRTKVGSFIGDHTKTGLGSLLNTGTVIGAFCNVLSSESLSPPVIPSFCQYRDGRIVDRGDLGQLLYTAAVVMKRRGWELTDTHKDFFCDLYDQTADYRQRVVRDSDYRYSRKNGQTA